MPDGQELEENLTKLAGFYFHLLGILAGCSATILVLTLGFRFTSDIPFEGDHIIMASIGTFCALFSCLGTAFLYSFVCIAKGGGIIMLFGLATSNFLLSTLVFMWSLVLTFQVFSEDAVPASVTICIFMGIVLAGLTYIAFTLWWQFKRLSVVVSFVILSVALFYFAFELGSTFQSELKKYILELAKIAFISVPAFIVSTGIFSMICSLHKLEKFLLCVVFPWIILLDLIAAFLIFTYSIYDKVP